jgi:hypothetical protein
MTDDARWPWPGDSTLDRSRRVAWTYREALLAVDPAACTRIDLWARQNGQGWVLPEDLEYGLDALLTVKEAALYANVQERTIHTWHQRGLPWASERGEPVRVRLLDLVSYEADRRRARATGKRTF